eukprot:jgi/Bigna1/73888/fgenesh1_pg.26_\
MSVEQEFKKLLEAENEEDFTAKLENLKTVVRVDGALTKLGLRLPNRNKEGKTNLRGNLWKLMLGVVYEEKGGARTALEKYKEQLKKGENKVQGKVIRHDVFRTFPKLEIFDLESQKRKMTRILHAVSHKSNFKYTQDAAYILDETEFEKPEKFSILFGSKRCLQNSRQTLSLCTKPLEQVVLLLDVVFAMGIQYHVLIYVAQLMSLREKVNARYVSSQVSYLKEKLEDQPELLDELVRHTTDRQLCEKLIRWEKSSPADTKGKTHLVEERRSSTEPKNSSEVEKANGASSGKQTTSEPAQPADTTSKDDGRHISEDTGRTTLVVGVLLFAVVGIFLVALAVVYNENL